MCELSRHNKDKKMLKIRFFRIGKKHQPIFRIVVTDKKNPPQGGRFLEILGFWNPLTKEKNLKIERIKYWLSKGAKLSDTVYNLLIKENLIEGKKIPVHKKSKKKIEEKLEIKEELKTTEQTGPEKLTPKEEMPKEGTENL